MIVVADTSPLCYLVLVDQIEVLASLFGQVVIPPAVLQELGHPRTPAPVQKWAASPPSWLEVRQALHVQQISGLSDCPISSITLHYDSEIRAPSRRGAGGGTSTGSWPA